MHSFSLFTKSSVSLLYLLYLSPISNARSIRRSDVDPGTKAAFLGTTNPADLVLWNRQTGVQYHDVSQGTSGDCWLDASMASVAYADPGHIGKIMVDTGTQARVTLFDGANSKDFTVPKRTINSMKASYSVAAPSVTDGQFVWPACLEDAFMDLAQDPATGIDSHLNGGTGTQAFSAMYGPSVPLTYYNLDTASDDDLWAVWANVATKPTVSSTRTDPNKATELANGLPSDHEYSAIRCDRGKGIVTLRNPWGMVSENPKTGFSNNGGAGVTGRGDGVFDVSFADWKKFFGDVTAVA